MPRIATAAATQMYGSASTDDGALACVLDSSVSSFEKRRKVASFNRISFFYDKNTTFELDQVSFEGSQVLLQLVHAQ